MSQKCLFLVIFETNYKSFLLIYPKIIVKNDSLNSYYTKVTIQRLFYPLLIPVSETHSITIPYRGTSVLFRLNLQAHILYNKLNINMIKQKYYDKTLVIS